MHQIIAGYSEDDASDDLTKDPVFTQILGTNALASQPVYLAFLNGLMTNRLKN